MTRRDHVAFLDHARGVAIICVFLYHALYQPFNRDELDWSGWFRDFNAPGTFLALEPLTWGWCGVAIFFVISGFCIHLSFSRMQVPSITEFLLRRWFRIYPPFLVALLFFAVVYPHSRLDLHTRYGLGELASHLLLLHNFNNKTEYGINVSFWSIAVEFQLYLLYPLLLLAASRIGWKRVLLITAMIEIALRLDNGIYSLVTHHNGPAFLNDSPFYFWFSWAAGAAVAEAYVKGEALPFARTSPWLWAGLLIAADQFKPLSSFSFTFAALTAAAIISRLLSPQQPRPAPSRSWLWKSLSRQLQLAGVCSYSIYLVHHPIIESWPQLVRWVWPSAEQYHMIFYACCLASWAVILPLSWYMYRFIELPAIEMGKRVISARRKRLAMNAARAAAL